MAMTELEKQLVVLSSLGICIFHADGHRHIEYRETYYGYNFSEELRKHNLSLNNKIYGGVKEAIMWIDRAFEEMYGEDIISYGGWVLEDIEYSIDFISNTSDRLHKPKNNDGGLY